MLASTFAAALAAALCIGRAAAHGGVTAYSNGGNFYPGWRAYNTPVGQTTIGRPYDTFDPIESVSASTLACNNDGNSGPNQLVATVKAGSTITAYWGSWPHDTGPVMTYLAKCPGTTCTGVNANGLKWFKIDEAGLLSGTVNAGLWAAKKMITDNSTWTSTIPASVPSGPYLIRHETIALHSMPAQHYPECAELLITDGGSLEPTGDELVTFPGAYGQNDPGINIVLYSEAAKTSTTYVIPGPALYKGAQGNNASPSSTTTSRATTTSAAPSSTTTTQSTAAPTTTSTQANSSSAVPTTTTSAAPSTTAPANGAATVTVTVTVTGACSAGSTGSVAPPASTPTQGQALAARYAQCGGRNWTGATACVAPFTCEYSNEYYSQCL